MIAFTVWKMHGRRNKGGPVGFKGGGPGGVGVLGFGNTVFFGMSYISFRALTDIRSGPKVQKFFKIGTVRKPKIFLPGSWTFKTFKNQKIVEMARGNFR